MDVPAVRFGDPFTDAKAETGSFDRTVCIRVDTVIFVEHVRDGVTRDADSGVTDRQDMRVVFGRQLDVDRAAVR